eukprot:1126924-Prorocentrum_minimum.AAC.2
MSESEFSESAPKALPAGSLATLQRNRASMEAALKRERNMTPAEMLGMSSCNIIYHVPVSRGSKYPSLGHSQDL